MKDDNLYEIFHILSRIIVIFTIIVLIIGLVIRFNQNKPNIKSFVTNQKPTIAIPSEKSITEAISTSTAKLNLKGPFVCDYSSPEATASVSLKDNNAYVQIKKQSKISFVLLKGDCIYYWKNFSLEGEKMCNLSPYIVFLGQLPLSKLLENNQILSLLGNFGINQTMVSSILNSCKKEEINDQLVFELPKNVVFKEKKL